MRFNYTGRMVALSEREQGKLDRKVQKIHRILGNPGGMSANVHLSKERHLCKAEVTLRALRHTLVVAGSGDSTFIAMNAALEKLEKQVLRNKHKLIDIRRPGKQRDEPSAVVADVMTNPMGQYSDEGASNQQVNSRIVRSNTIEQKPITLEEALLKLENPARDFVSYRDADNGRVQVLVRLRNGEVELVEGG